jgi:hypothetical protein
MKDSTAAVVIIIALAVGGLIVASWNGLPITNPFGNKPITCPIGTQWDSNANACVQVQTVCPGGQIWNGNMCVQQVSAGAATALYKITLTDAFTGTTLGNANKDTGVSVFFANNLDSRVDNVSITGAATAGTAYLHQGDVMYIFAFSGYNYAYYPVLFKVTVGGPVMRETPVYSGATWQFVETQVGTMSLSSEATPYWVITPNTALGLYQRETAASIHFQAGTQAGSTAVSTAANSFATYTSTTAALKYTATSTTFTLKCQIDLAHVSVTWGEPIIVISSSTPRTFQARFAAMWMLQNNTATGDSDNGPLSLGFTRIPNFGSTAWKGYYMILNPLFGSDGRGLRSDPSGNPGSITINIPMATGSVASSTEIAIEFWFVDCQAPSDVAAGTYNSAPTYYGAIGAAHEGLAALISASGFAQTSGTPSTSCSTYTVISTA